MQINNCMENKLSKYKTGFRKSRGAQHSLMIMYEKWKNVLDKGEHVCVLFKDLSKAFDAINRDNLSTKLRAYGFSNDALNLICSEKKTGSQGYKSITILVQKRVIAGVPQAFIDGLLLFNLFIYDVVFFITNFLSNYTDENSLHNTGKGEVISRFSYAMRHNDEKRLPLSLATCVMPRISTKQ